MNSKALVKLEFNKIINQLVDLATSPSGKTLCKELVPFTDYKTIKEMQDQTSDSLSRIFKKGSIIFSGNHSMKSITRCLEIGSVLSSAELLKIASLLECTSRTKAYGRNEKSEDTYQDSLSELFEQLTPLSPLLLEIRRCIISEEEFSDDASPTLRQIRRNKLSINDKIHTGLNKIINGNLRTYLQDAVITMRNNRYCVPVKAEYKNQVSGMIHDQSSSGSTLFIEPTSIVNLNNELKELDLKEEKEIEIILANLSMECSAYCYELQTNHELLTTLDFIFARGNLAMKQNATKPLFSKDRSISIRKGRHPLLDQSKVVPIDIHLGKEFDLLIVTGPNTGGKTVSLKTVGLFTLMGQAGLHIPALDRSVLSIFHDVFADIGDEQSIEQSLSTFSSHMTNIVTILEHCDENSLCLFDELGAGTDPTEGAALAIAILNHLHARKIRTMATTHYSELKVFALTNDFVENACCEFDVETLKPTYRLLIGIPGKSNAFAISSKLGLPDYIIDKAKEQITEEKESFEDLLTDLEESRVTIEKERQEIASYKDRIKTLEEQLKSKREKIDQSRDRILREANEEAREILQEAKSIADETIRSVQKAGKVASVKDMEKARGNIREKISEKNNKLSLNTSPTPNKQLKPNQLKLGDSVKILSLGLKGTISSLPDAKGNLFVQCGIMRSQTNIKDIILIEEEAFSPKTFARTNSGNIKISKTSNIKTEINLLGKTVDEAIAVLDKYLDDAYLSHLPNVRIVHGKGTGALRSAIHSHLKRISYIKSFRLGEFGEGDAGVTIAEFKQ